jgi:hypothetical protein
MQKKSKGGKRSGGAGVACYIGCGLVIVIAAWVASWIYMSTQVAHEPPRRPCTINALCFGRGALISTPSEAREMQNSSRTASHTFKLNTTKLNTTKLTKLINDRFAQVLAIRGRVHEGAQAAALSLTQHAAKKMGLGEALIPKKVRMRVSVHG